MQVVMKPSMKDSLSAEPSFLLATKDKGPIVPVWVKGYSSSLGHKGKAVHGYGWWQGGELGTTLSSGRGCRNSVCSLCHWSMESGNVDQSVRKEKRRQHEETDYAESACLCVGSINQNTIFPRPVRCKQEPHSQSLSTIKVSSTQLQNLAETRQRTPSNYYL